VRAPPKITMSFMSASLYVCGIPSPAIGKGQQNVTARRFPS
jgi:hypothetical protein